MKIHFKYINYWVLLSTDGIRNKSVRRKFSIALYDVFNDFNNLDNNSNNTSLFKDLNQEYRLRFTFTDNIHRNHFNDYSSGIIASDYKEQNLKSKTVSIINNSLFYKDGEVEFALDISNPYSVLVKIFDSNNIKKSLRIFHKGFKNHLESQASLFYYRIFLMFTQLWNVNHDYSYIHAASFEINNRSVLCSADSGVGKSSLLFALSRKKEYKFISDDLSVINRDGSSSFLGRPLSLKPYHLNYFSFLKPIVRNSMSFMQRLQWEILQDKRLIYRMSYKKIFENKSTNSDIKLCLHFCNHDKQSFDVRDITTEEFISLASTIINNEFFLLFRKLDNMASVPSSRLPSSLDILEKTKNLYQDAFNDIPKKIILIPYKSNPNNLFDFLKSIECLD